MLFARNFDDVLTRDFKIYTLARSVGMLFVFTGFFLNSNFWLLGPLSFYSPREEKIDIFSEIASRWARTMVPVGQHGIKRVSQTQLYHVYGPIAPFLVASPPIIAFYMWYRTAILTGKMFYNRVILQDRLWIMEADKNNTWGDFYFKDTPVANDDNISDLARYEMGKKPIIKGEWVK